MTIEQEVMGRKSYRTIKEFFNDEKNEKDYQEWLKKRRKKGENNDEG